MLIQLLADTQNETNLSSTALPLNKKRLLFNKKCPAQARKINKPIFTAKIN